MTRAPRGIVAVGHDAYRAGAQIAFLRILRWIRDHADAELRLVLATGGALEPDYEAVLPTTVLHPADSGPLARPNPGLATRVRRRLGIHSPPRTAALPPLTADVVYANSVATATLAAEIASDLGRPLVLHVHELEMSMQRFTNITALRDAFTAVDQFIAVSDAVAANLVERHGIDPARIRRVAEPVPTTPPPRDPRRAAQLRMDLGIPADAVVVGGSGTVDWRKGPDVFLLVARAVGDAPRAGGPPIHFVWVGGEPRELLMVEHDLRRLRLDATTHFVGPRDDPAPYFELFDVFFLSSREDPFPLVCLEAAVLGAPIVCYADGGGMPELVEDDAGVVVPYLDIAATAACLVELADDAALRHQLGQRAEAKVRERCAVDVVATRVLEVLGEVAADRPS